MFNPITNLLDVNEEPLTVEQSTYLIKNSNPVICKMNKKRTQIECTVEIKTENKGQLKQ